MPTATSSVGTGTDALRVAGASSEGFRWPAEWEPHAATWLSWPHNPDTWPGCLGGAEDAMVAVVRALAGRELVRINVSGAEQEERVRKRLFAVSVDPDREVEFQPFPTDDAWVRDHGPIFVVREGEKALLDFGFDAWGRKYPPWQQDDAIPGRVAAALGLRRFVPGFVLEGGSVDGDGAGTVLTTESCLLDDSRRVAGEAPRTPAAMEERLAAWLGARRVVWLPGGVLHGDDTDGHVDVMARFAAPGVVVTAVAAPGHPDHQVLLANRTRLESARDADGRALALVTLPSPPARRYRELACPATYVNFYLANGVALVPIYGVDEDERALAILGEVLADRDVVPILATDLIVGLGAVHCLTQQEPALQDTV
jgi:agmatine deiminase